MPDEAERMGREIFGLEAKAAALYSERDQNFALTTAAGARFVLKIAKLDEERGVLEFQNAALRHVAGKAELAVSRVIPGLDGEEIGSVRDDRGRSYHVRLVDWIEGELFVDAAPHDPPLLASLGSALARMDAALADFRHPAMHRPLHWDLRQIDQALRHLPLLSAGQRTVVERFRPEWERLDWNTFRTGVVHNDANDYNVLVRDGRVCGFIDFGDMLHTAIVCDPAIALTYAMLDQPDPVAAGLEVARAYHRQFPLQATEAAALYPLVLSRLCMSILYAAHNAQAKCGDAYQTVTADPAWRLLRRLAELPAADVAGRFQDACAGPA